MRAKYAWSLFLLVMAAPMASAAPVVGFGPFTARAHGTAQAAFFLNNPGPTPTAFRTVSLNLSVHRDAPGGNVKDDAQGSIVLQDLTTGTVISRIDIAFAQLVGYPNPFFGPYQALELTGPARVNDAVLNDANVAAYDVILIPGASPNIILSVFASEAFGGFGSLTYTATLDTVEVTPG